MKDVRPADPWSDPTWDAFVQASPDGWVWGLAGWQRLIERVPEWDLKPLSFELWENGERVALMPMHLTRDGTAGSSGWGWVGPMLCPGLDPTQRKGVLRRVMTQAEHLAREAGAHRVVVGTMPITTRNLADTSGVNPFFELGYRDVSTNSCVIDLNKDEDSLYSGASEFARRRIRKARKLGWTATPISWGEAVDRYYAIHTETYTRTGVSPHPRAYFAGIAQEMAPAGHAKLWAARKGDGEPRAFLNLGRFGTASYYHTGCSQSEALSDGANYLLLWEAILGEKRAGGQVFDIGEVFFDVTDGKQVGLTQFKSKFGGSLRRFFKASKDLPSTQVPPVSQPEPTPDAQTARQHSERGLGRRLMRRLRAARKGGV
jgi:hypothetical protein